MDILKAADAVPVRARSVKGMVSNVAYIGPRVSTIHATPKALCSATLGNANELTNRPAKIRKDTTQHSARSSPRRSIIGRTIAVTTPRIIEPYRPYEAVAYLSGMGISGGNPSMTSSWMPCIIRAATPMKPPIDARNIKPVDVEWRSKSFKSQKKSAIHLKQRQHLLRCSGGTPVSTSGNINTVYVAIGFALLFISTNLHLVMLRALVTDTVPRKAMGVYFSLQTLFYVFGAALTYA
mmetsp:Transcript_212/g.189  ORF Transcript_212/g.189 Transcript_212/m.189 type:complete len:237 (-) Transcript_212:9-719(-)